MLVYGDTTRIETLNAKKARLARALGEARFLFGLERHGALVRAFIEASELVQEIEDARMEAWGHDDISSEEETGMRLLLALARSIDLSWRSGFRHEPPDLRPALHALEGPPTLRCKRAEGHAFYALYPEVYLEAARRSGLGPETIVIGIRSIGAGLAALVAAALDAPPPVTLRPVGHPFRREVRMGARLLLFIAKCRARPFAVVDEGPGLSGSSFGAVADALEAAGVPRARIHFFPSHGGDLGPEARPEHHARWASAPRHYVGFDTLLRDTGMLEAWIADAIGPLDAPLQDLSGGAWRVLRYADRASWPAANIRQERLKFLARAGGRAYLVKFMGLDYAGEKAFARARALAEAGFSPAPIALRHGFLIEHWIEGARGLDQVSISRGALMERIGAYLAFRVKSFPASEGEGASLRELRAMACRNAELALGPRARTALERRLSTMESLAEGMRRVHTDNRMQHHEWLLAPDGRLLKTDAVDHSAAHDLIGAQSILWDVAGARLAFDLSDQETAFVRARVSEMTGVPLGRALLAALIPCHLAFTLGAAALAADAIGGEEADRLRAAAAQDALRLAALLEEPVLSA